jgi:hypothetical protein
MRTMSGPRRCAPVVITGLLSLAALLFLAACGNNSTTTAGAASASATPTCSPTPRFQSVSGTVQSVGSGLFTVLDRQGQSRQISYNSNTRFTKEVQESVSALKEGELVTVVVSQNADNSYSAVSIADEGSGTGSGSGFQGGQGPRQGFQNGSRSGVNAACFTRRSGQGSAFGNGGTATAGNARAVRGSITQIYGNQLTVTDSSGNNFVLTLTSSTRVIKTEAASSSDLKAGVSVLVVGSSGAQGQLTATAVTINPQSLGTGLTRG